MDQEQINELKAWQTMFAQEDRQAGRLITQALQRMDELQSALSWIDSLVNGKSDAGNMSHAPSPSATQHLLTDETSPLPGGNFLHPEYAGSLDGDITVLVQGPLSSVGLERIRDYQLIGPVVISCWETCDLSLLDGIDLRQVAVVISPVPALDIGYNPQNLLYQAVATVNGLRHVRTPYVLRLRTDDSWEDLYPILRALREDKSKIVTTNVFWRDDAFCKYHMSDHIIACSTSVLLSAFEQVVDDCLAHRPVPFPIAGSWPAESQLAQTILRTMGIEPDTAISKQQVKAHFRMVPVSELGQYHIEVFKKTPITPFHMVNKKRQWVTTDDLIEAHTLTSMDEL